MRNSTIRNTLLARTLPPMRTWQQEALDTSFEFLIQQNKNHLYICAPTASGKSRYMFELCETHPLPGDRVILVGLAQVCDQLIDGFLNDYGCIRRGKWLISPMGHRIHIGTIQGFTAKANDLDAKGQVSSTNPAIMIFDEIHVGGSNAAKRTGDENEYIEMSSVQRIFHIFAPQKRVYVSATTQTADENLLGQKSGHFYRYSLSRAYQDGILNPVDMREVQTGTTIKIKSIENTLGSNMEYLETLKADDLETLAKQMADKSVSLEGALTGVQWLVKARHREMIKLYGANHYGQQAIFYSPNIESAEQAAREFTAYMNSSAMLGMHKGKRQPIAHAYHSKADNAVKLLAAFENNQTAVLFVVGMLQEGFNMPSLELAFDCRFHRVWNNSKIARLIQKIGRLMRRNPNKGRSSYYYARDISDYHDFSLIETDANDEVNEKSSDTVSKVVPDDVLMEAAGKVAATIITDADGARDFDSVPAWQKEDVIVGMPVIETVEVLAGDFDDASDVDVASISRETIKVVATPMFVAVDAYGHHEGKVFDFCSIIGSIKDTLKKELLYIAKHGKSLPSYYDNYLIYNEWRNLNKSHNINDINFIKKFEQHRAEYIPSDNHFVTRQLLLSMARKTEKLPPNTSLLGKVFSASIDRSSNMYNSEFTKKIKSASSSWKKYVITTISDDFEIKSLLISHAKEGIMPSSCSNTLYRAWNNYTNERTGRGKNYDFDFVKKIALINPKWMLESSLFSNGYYAKSILEDAIDGKDIRNENWESNIFSYRFYGESADRIEIIKLIRPDWI